MTDKNKKFLIKYQIERIFHEWLMELPDYTLFHKPDKNENDIFIKTADKNERPQHKNQSIFKE